MVVIVMGKIYEDVKWIVRVIMRMLGINIEVGR